MFNNVITAINHHCTIKHIEMWKNDNDTTTISVYEETDLTIPTITWLVDDFDIPW